jgi:hypothetical protein
MSRQSSGEETQPPGAFPSQEDDQDDEEETLGALRVPGMDSTDRDGDEEDGLTATDLRHERSAAESTSMTVEAQLVEENEREQHEEELRQQFLGELGQVGQQAEVVEEDNGSKTRRRALLYSGIVVVLSVSIIIGSVFGTRDTSLNAVSVPASTAPTISSIPSETPSETPSLRPSPSPSIKASQTPTVAPLDNNFCKEAYPIDRGGNGIAASLENAMQQSVVHWEGPLQLSDSQPGLWYKVRGVRACCIFCLILIVMLTSSFLPICSTLGKTKVLLPKQAVASIFRSIRHAIKLPLPAALGRLFMETPPCSVHSHGRQQSFQGWATSCWGQLQMVQRSIQKRQVAVRPLTQQPLALGTLLLGTAE